VRQDLDKVLQRLDDADLSWSPGEGLRTVAGQLLEIANKEKEVLVWIQTGVWPDDGPDAFDVETATIERVRDTLASLRRDTYAYIDSLSDSELEELVQSPEGWWEAMRLTACPRSEVLRNIAAHEWYHTGQLIIYLWMRGDDPYKW
jgi:uncharacterized damage-inducible protein DinB